MCCRCRVCTPHIKTIHVLHPFARHMENPMSSRASSVNLAHSNNNL